MDHLGVAGVCCCVCVCVGVVVVPPPPPYTMYSITPTVTAITAVTSMYLLKSVMRITLWLRATPTEHHRLSHLMTPD
jgi:hypothetical protein